MPLSPASSVSVSHTVTNPLTDPVYVNDASVTVTILDSNGDELAGEAWPVALPYVSGSNGNYSKTFEPFENLVIGEIYDVIISVEGVDGLKSKCTSTERAIKRIC